MGTAVATLPAPQLPVSVHGAAGCAPVVTGAPEGLSPPATSPSPAGSKQDRGRDCQGVSSFL